MQLITDLSGETIIYSGAAANTCRLSVYVAVPFVSPDDTRIAFPSCGADPAAGDLPPYTTINRGTTLVGRVDGLTRGWLDDSRALIATYGSGMLGPYYIGTILVDETGLTLRTFPSTPRTRTSSNSVLLHDGTGMNVDTGAISSGRSLVLTAFGSGYSGRVTAAGSRLVWQLDSDLGFEPIP
jgi:hypothetical protein